jgi:hypothetical protein
MRTSKKKLYRVNQWQHAPLPFKRGVVSLMIIAILFKSAETSSRNLLKTTLSYAARATVIPAAIMISPLKSVLPNLRANASTPDRSIALEPAFVRLDKGKTTAFLAPFSTSFLSIQQFISANHHQHKTEQVPSAIPQTGGLRQVVDRSIDINVDAEDIFHAVTDIERYRDWTGNGIEKIHVIS